MSSNGSTNNGKIWGIAAIVGVIAFFALKLMAEYTFWPALLLAILIGVLVAILLWIGFYRDADDDVSGLTGASGSSAADHAAAKTSKAATAPVITDSATNAGNSNATNTAKSLMGDAGNALKTDTLSKAKAPRKVAAKKSTAAKTATSKASTTTAKTAKAKTTKAKTTKAATAKPAGAKTKAAKAKPAAAKKAVTKTATKTAPARKPVAKDGKPATLKKARASGADDLKLLKGVGPGLEKTLNELGFHHFDQVAGWRKKEIEWVDSRLKFKGRIERDEWIKQAKTLAKGGATEFSKRAKKA